MIANKVVWKSIWYSTGIKYISDLLDNDGNFLSCKEFEEKYGLPNSFLDYVSYHSRNSMGMAGTA